MDMKKLMTKVEIEREMRHKRVCNRFRLLVVQYPQYAPSRLMGAIALEENMTLGGVRRILVSNNVYQKQKS